MNYTRIIMLRLLRRVQGGSADKMTGAILAVSAETEPLISSHNPDYLSVISMKGDQQPFQLAVTVDDYLGVDVRTDLGTLVSLKATGQFLEKYVTEAVSRCADGLNHLKTCVAGRGLLNEGSFVARLEDSDGQLQKVIFELTELRASPGVRLQKTLRNDPKPLRRFVRFSICRLSFLSL